ncbi:hypothetical protein WUBG_04975, partial [Wuchereria bancrofti]
IKLVLSVVVVVKTINNINLIIQIANDRYPKDIIQTENKEDKVVVVVVVVVVIAIYCCCCCCCASGVSGAILNCSSVAYHPLRAILPPDTSRHAYTYILVKLKIERK